MGCCTKLESFVQQFFFCMDEIYSIMKAFMSSALAKKCKSC